MPTCGQPRKQLATRCVCTVIFWLYSEYTASHSTMRSGKVIPHYTYCTFCFTFLVKLLSLVLHSFVPVLWTHSFTFHYILHFTFIYALTLHYNYLLSVTHCENFAQHSSVLHSTNNVKCVNCKNMEQNSAQSQLSITLHFPSKPVFHSKSDSKIFESITYSSKIVKDTVQKSAAGVSGLRIMTLT